MSLWHPEDWDGEISAEVRDQVLAVRGAGQLAPVVVLVSSTFEGGRALLADLGHPGVESGSPAPLIVVPGLLLSELLDRRLGAGVGELVMSEDLTSSHLIRGVLVLPETIEVHAISPEPGAKKAWPFLILDLAGNRLHVSDDGGATWRSSNFPVSS